MIERNHHPAAIKRAALKLLRDGMSYRNVMSRFPEVDLLSLYRWAHHAGVVGRSLSVADRILAAIKASDEHRRVWCEWLRRIIPGKASRPNMAGGKGPHPREVRLKALRLLSEGKTARQTASRCGVSLNAIYNWKKRAIREARRS